MGQSALFTVSSGLVSLAAMGCSALAARSLSSDAFGSFSFAKSLLLFLALIFEFGVCSAAARELAQAESADRGRLLGATLLVLVPVSVGFSLALLVVAPLIDHVFHVRAATALMLSAPFAFAYAFRQQFALQLARSVGRLHVYSLTTLVGQALFFVFLAITVTLGGANRMSVVLLLQSVSFGVATVVAIVWLRPVLRGARAYVPHLLADTRRWGFHLYVGRVLGLGTYNMDVLMLAGFVNARNVGYYALAGSIAGATGLPITGLMSALYPRMVHSRRLDGRWLLTAYAIGGASVLVVWAAAGPFINLAFTSRYAAAASLAIPLTIASSLNGVTTVYSSFLSAQARGRELRNAGFVLTGSNLLLNLALIPTFGAEGAAWASAAALLANLITHVVLYRRTVARANPLVA